MPLSGALSASDDGVMKTRLERTYRGHRTHIVQNPRNPEQLVVRRDRRWARVVARALASSLDRQLAAGRSPESTHLLATRASQLVSAVMRRELVQNIEHLLELANRPAGVRSPRVLARRQAIIDVEPDLRTMLTKLAIPLPTSARGVAIVRMLLTDGTGPLYNQRNPTSLRDAVRDAAAHLESTWSADDVTQAAIER